MPYRRPYGYKPRRMNTRPAYRSVSRRFYSRFDPPRRYSRSNAWRNRNFGARRRNPRMARPMTRRFVVGGSRW